MTFPATLSGENARRQGRRIRRHGQGGRDAGEVDARRRIRQVARPRIARQAARDDQGPADPRAHAAMSRQQVKRQLLDELDKPHTVRAAADAGRAGIREHLEDGDRTTWKRRAQTFEDEDTTEEKAQGRIPRHRRAARAARPGDRRDRREEQDQGHRRGIEPRAHGARAPVSRPGTGGLRLLPQEPEALAGLRAPIFEDKVVDYLLELAKVTEKQGHARGAVQGRRRRANRPLDGDACAGARIRQIRPVRVRQSAGQPIRRIAGAAVRPCIRHSLDPAIGAP